MKKLLTTSAILSAVAFASSANAADLQVNVGGFLDFQAAYTADDVVGESNAGTTDKPLANEVNFGNDAEIHFSVDGKADNGLEYGAVIELEADIDSGDNYAGGTNADKTFAFLQGGFGRVELGGNTGAEEALSVNTSTFASATGGVDGDFYRYTQTPTGDTFLIAPDLALAAEGNGAGGYIDGNEDATKITYYTPRVSGFQAGVSYIPNVEDSEVGQTGLREDGYENVITAGVNYSGDFDGVGVKAAATSILSGDNKAAASADLEGWDVGANVSFSGFTVGGSYGDWQDTLGTNVDASYWDAGIGYEAGAYSASVTYLDSNVETGAADDDFSNLVVGVDYKLAPGLTPYAEVSFFDFDGNGTTIADDDNEGTVLILGTELSF